MNHEKKVTTSKLILYASYTAAIILSAIVVFGAFKGYDMMYVATIAGLAWAEVAAANIWYYKKAEKENIIKIALGLSEKLNQPLDIGQIVDKL